MIGITKTREEIIDKIIEALPRADQWQTFVFILKNDVLYDTVTLDVLIEKIESHELELQKKKQDEQFMTSTECGSLL